MGDSDAPFRQKQLNVSEAQAEKVVQPDGMADDLGREAVPGVGGALGRHLKKPELKVRTRRSDDSLGTFWADLCCL